MNPKKQGLAAVLAITLSTTTFAEDREVNFYNWSDYISPEILENFTKETGIKVNYDVYDSNEVLEAKLMSGGSGYDVVIPTGSFLERAEEVGQGVDINYFIPKEGTVVWFDLIAMPMDGPNRESAYQLIDYLLKGENAAAISNYVYYAVANKAAEPMVKADVLHNPSVYPSEEAKANLFTQNAHMAKFDRLLTRA